jgi:hypothetical protein
MLAQVEPTGQAPVALQSNVQYPPWYGTVPVVSLQIALAPMPVQSVSNWQPWPTAVVFVQRPKLHS